MFTPGTVVVELGFGQGYFLEAARAVGIRAIGVDRDSDLVAEGLRGGFDVREGDVRDLQTLIPETVDGMFAAHVIEHLQPGDVGSLLSAAARAVRPGGLLLLATPNMQDWRVASEWFWLDPTHVRPYPSGAVKQLLDPSQWHWESDGYEPIVFTRETAVVLLQKLRFGLDYGRSGRWYRLRRLPSG